MIVAKKSWLGLLFTVQGSTFVNIWPRVAFVLVVSILVELISKNGWLAFSLTPFPFTVVGLALAIFLGFRNSAAYDRYWEGRKLWGALVNVSRNFAIQTEIVEANAQNKGKRNELVRDIIAYVHSLRHRLRDSCPDDELQTYIQPSASIAQIKSFNNIPFAILDKVTKKLVELWKSGRLETYQLVSLQSDLSKMLDVQGGCERIQSTPIPFTYSVLTHRTVMIYCLALPFGLHDIIGWAMPVVTTFIAYAFLGLDDLGDEIEQPFAQQPNSLPLHSICRTIEINLLELIGEQNDKIPAPIAPINDVLD